MLIVGIRFRVTPGPKSVCPLPVQDHISYYHTVCSNSTSASTDTDTRSNYDNTVRVLQYRTNKYTERVVLEYVVPGTQYTDTSINA